MNNKPDISAIQGSIWKRFDGTWTVASFVARAICRCPEITPAEAYFVLTSLGIDRQFNEYWNHNHFFERAGLPEQASRSVDTRRDGHIALTGDHAWSAGDTEEAKRRYEESIAIGDSSVMAGIGGLVRLHFVLDQYENCIDAFRRGCPPPAFYERHAVLPKPEAGRDWMEPYRRLLAEYPGTSPYFVSDAKYMCRAIVLAAVRSGNLDAELRSMISHYFSIEDADVDELARAVAGDETEVSRLRKRLAPKPMTGGPTLKDLKAGGDTERSRRLCERIPQSESFVEATAALVDSFLDDENSSSLDRVIEADSPFGIADLDSLILEEALYSRDERIARAPNKRVQVLRRFNSVCRYPKFDFLTDFLEVVIETGTPIEPGDIIASILGLQWYKTQYRIDDTGPGGSRVGFGKMEISENRAWLEIVLRDYPDAFNRDHFQNRDDAVALLHRAYMFLRDRFNDLRREERWINEARLGDALERLFGKGEVRRHARPVWLCPQHLDYFVPRFSLAVEYMGAQHYKPIEVFGGKQAFEETRVRDERKRDLCERMGVSLVFVTHEEDIGQRAREIHAQFGGS